MIDPLTGAPPPLGERYVITRELGVGAMATVYLAEDVRHHRNVAVKVLHPELSAVLGPERFLKEIALTASLQHPHILPLFDSGIAEGQLWYVMPYVEGETLRSRLERERQLPLADALRIAGEVADALVYAHAHGVVHRDIKPENILLQNGHALVADFGIALAVEHAGGARMTQTGLSLGTPQYMAPEQAMGDPHVDGRADIYSLAALTYEMLAGEPPFTGPNAQAVVARVMTERPRPLGELRETVPPHVEHAVHTALARLAADRFPGAAEFAAALGAPATPAPAHETRIRREGPPSAASGRPGPLTVATVAVASLAIVASAFWLGGRLLARRAAPLEFGHSLRVTWEPGLEVQPAVAPDGRSVAYAAGTSTYTRIYVREVAGGRAIRLTDDSTAVEANPGWSPDGTRILFLARGAVFSAPAAGGPPRQEVPAGHGSPVTSAAWAPDGQTIAYALGDSLLVHTPDGAGRVVARLLEPTLCTWSPTAELIACTSGNARYLTIGPQFGNLSPNRIVICRVRDGRTTTVTDSTSLNVSPAWSRDGRWLYYVSDRNGRGDIYAQRIGRDGRASGAAMRLTTGLGAQSISVSADGLRFAYAVYSTEANVWSLPLPAGAPVSAARATPVTRGSQLVDNLAVSPDGRWLLYDSDLAGNSDIYRVPLAGGEPERLTTDPADEFAPDLSPDGTEIAFHSWRTGSRDIWVKPLDGRPLQHVTSAPGHEWIPAWSPDGRALVFLAGTDRRSVWIVRRRPDGTWGAPVQRLARGFWPVWSPDGRWIAFVTQLLGGSLAVAPVDSGAPRVVLDATRPGVPRAERPQWAADGRTIYFKSHDARGMASIWSVPVAGGAPRPLIRFDDPARPSYRPQWALGRGRVYFPIEDRQSDVWLMEATPR